jgi:hypothetical protein
MKYKTNDVLKLIDVFSNLSEKGVDGLEEAISSVKDYPPNVLQAFLDGMNSIDPEVAKDNYWGTIGYLVLKINLVDDMKSDVIEKL